MRIVARDATEGAATLVIALRLHDPDRLEPDQVDLLGPDHEGPGPGRMAGASPTQRHERIGGPAVRPKGERQLGLRGAPARRGDVRPARAVTPLARHVRDHRCLIDPRAVAGGNLRGMTVETPAGLVAREDAAVV